MCPQTKPEYIKACTPHGLICVDGRGGQDCTYMITPEPEEEEEHEREEEEEEERHEEEESN